jgi:hypothetical protein
MLTPFETAQLAAAADSIISEMERQRHVDVERMFQLLDNFRDRLSDPPFFSHRGYQFMLAQNELGEEGIEVTVPAPRVEPAQS